MSTGFKTTISDCPICNNDLLFVEHISGVAFIKCKTGCSKPEIMKAFDRLYPKKPPIKKIDKLILPRNNRLFLDVLSHARSLGKAIPAKDLNHEMNIYIKMKAKHERRNSNG